ncbi:stage VI sporulation protein D [Ornithinibacillus salinisoli]|uniref:Stage VI sporulation protein D n=1 Tax=Ornithinibacillus salinisoli TaxID=1848459 RepID=A0ABW4W7C2_9BACI
MSNDQSVFSFELNESLYFERGQEVGEIMGISLEPEISIQPFNEYISIRGVVELQGSYLKTENTTEENEDAHFTDVYHSKRYMERVVDTEHDSAEFMHRFPVEISVPSYRVEDLDDVSVMITSFDYELPDPHQLQLMSTIEIHGINDQLEEARDVERSVKESVNNQEEQKASEEDTFQFEIRKQKEELEQEDLPSTQDDKEESNEIGRWKYKQTQTFSEFFQNENDDDNSPDDDDADSPEFSPEHLDYNESPSLYESNEIGRESSESSSESSSKQKADLRYLSDMFRNEEESYAKMRLCIVQEKDTLETIAERYDTTSMHIVKQNRLSDDSIAEGQLLYIPYRKQD